MGALQTFNHEQENEASLITSKNKPSKRSTFTEQLFRKCSFALNIILFTSLLSIFIFSQIEITQAAKSTSNTPHNNKNKEAPEP